MRRKEYGFGIANLFAVELNTQQTDRLFYTSVIIREGLKTTLQNKSFTTNVLWKFNYSNFKFQIIILQLITTMKNLTTNGLSLLAAITENDVMWQKAVDNLAYRVLELKERMIRELPN